MPFILAPRPRYALHMLPYTPIILGLVWVLGLWSTVLAESSTLPNNSAKPLSQVQQVLIETLSLTERGLQDSAALQQVISDRLAQAGFTPVSDAQVPHDITLRVKCEEQKTWAGPSKHRKGSHPSAAASRLWKGPACHFSYNQQGQPALWSWEVRTAFEDPREAAKAAGATNAGLYALQELQTQLAQDEFPLYLAAEWGQAERLITLYQQASEHVDRRRLILQLLGPLSTPAALSTIETATQDPALAITAITALGEQGEVAIPSLANLLANFEKPEPKLAALQALGEIATHSTTPALYDLFIQQLESPDPRMQAIAVRALGSLGDLRAVPPIQALNVQAWSNPSTHADMQALREALNWSLYQLDAQASSH